ncbi:MAG: glucosaminidase domain-containing protein [Antricoccus sp.]
MPPTAAQVRQRRLTVTLSVCALVIGCLIWAWPAAKEPVAPQGPSSTQQFISSVAAPAQQSQAQFAVPASVTIAQAILESDWASSPLTQKGNAYFGIKCTGNDGPYATGCLGQPTTECDTTGVCSDQVAQFRTYATIGDSFRDHGSLLATATRYAKAFQFSGSPDSFAQAIAVAGYATDPAYAGKLISLMQQYNLYRYDVASS